MSKKYDLKEIEKNTVTSKELRKLDRDFKKNKPSPIEIKVDDEEGNKIIYRTTLTKVKFYSGYCDIYIKFDKLKEKIIVKRNKIKEKITKIWSEEKNIYVYTDDKKNYKKNLNKRGKNNAIDFLEYAVMKQSITLSDDLLNYLIIQPIEKVILKHPGQKLISKERDFKKKNWKLEDLEKKIERELPTKTEPRSISTIDSNGDKITYTGWFTDLKLYSCSVYGKPHLEKTKEITTKNGQVQQEKIWSVPTIIKNIRKYNNQVIISSLKYTNKENYDSFKDTINHYLDAKLDINLPEEFLDDIFKPQLKPFMEGLINPVLDFNFDKKND